MNLGGITSANSRTIHVVTDGDLSDAGLSRFSACGRYVIVRRYEVGPANEVCLKCRKAMGWPMIVTWESQGHTFTTDFSRKAVAHRATPCDQHATLED